MVGVLAFGHVYFRRACTDAGIDWREVVHVTNIRKFAGITSVLLHVTASDRRLSHLLIEGKRLKLIPA